MKRCLNDKFCVYLKSISLACDVGPYKLRIKLVYPIKSDNEDVNVIRKRWNVSRKQTLIARTDLLECC